MNDGARENVLWTGLGLVAPLGARVNGALPKPGATGISIDTRTLKEGELFFAIKGDANDGHDYVEAAFDKGAAAAVVDEAHSGALSGRGPLYIVREVLPALEGLGIAARERSQARIIAVTGSVGKTSTKEALRLVLGAGGAVHASAASYNNHWGVPLSLARMPKRSDFGIYEIGMNHKGEITPLTGMVRPHVALVTTIAPVHLEYFASLDEIADAKAEIFSGFVPGGVAILNHDIAQFERLAAHAKASPAGYVASFGEHEKADARLIGAKVANDHTQIEAEICGEKLSYRIGAPGQHFALNSLGVLLAAKAFGIDLEAAAGALASFKAPAGRGERLDIVGEDKRFVLIDESYNASPASVRAALALAGSLKPKGEGRRIAILGDMLELGPRAAEMHKALAGAIAANHIDLVFTAGPLMKELFKALPNPKRGGWRPTARELEPFVLSAIKKGDIILVKGSNSVKMSAIVASLKGLGAAADAPARD
jgi:UDP-N-acetylmuramoyl-tripeptide--D-alanyl-D-alanine ligase